MIQTQKEKCKTFHLKNNITNFIFSKYTYEGQKHEFLQNPILNISHDAGDFDLFTL